MTTTADPDDARSCAIPRNPLGNRHVTGVDDLA